jgi:hypothetical protein
MRGWKLAAANNYGEALVRALKRSLESSRLRSARFVANVFQLGSECEVHGSTLASVAKVTVFRPDGASEFLGARKVRTDTRVGRPGGSVPFRKARRPGRCRRR